MASNLYMYKLLLVDTIETNIIKGRQPLGYTQWKTDLIFFSKIVVHTRHGSELTQLEKTTFQEPQKYVNFSLLLGLTLNFPN